jgi:dihydrofolate reductase/thymidylate synthase
MNKMKKNAVIMGFNTWKSLDRTGGLQNRMNVVIDRDAKTVCVDEQGVVYANTLDDALDYTNTDDNVESVYVIGGGKIYQEALKHSGLDKVLLTKINRKYEGDVKFPRLKSEFELEKVKKGIDQDLEFRTYKRTTDIHEEYQYLDKIDDIMREGEVCSDRTGVGIKSCWGAQMTYDIGKHFPLLTTKRTFLRVITEELLWFLRGSTNNKELKERNVHIWDGNTTRKYLDSIGLTDREEDDGGPIYGFNFRHFGAEYVDCHTDYTGQGVDQVAEALRLIRENPDSRRILISLWNPSTLKDACLPACHMLYHFRVYGDTLNCAMVQRSGDMGLGVPFNIASATMMTYIFAHLTGKKPGKLVHTIHDAHVYTNHEEALHKQLTRTPYPFPKMNIVDRGQTKVEDFRLEDFELLGYECYPTLKMDMAV